MAETDEIAMLKREIRQLKEKRNKYNALKTDLQSIECNVDNGLENVNTANNYLNTVYPGKRAQKMSEYFNGIASETTKVKSNISSFITEINNDIDNINAKIRRKESKINSLMDSMEDNG